MKMKIDRDNLHALAQAACRVTSNKSGFAFVGKALMTGASKRLTVRAGDGVREVVATRDAECDGLAVVVGSAGLLAAVELLPAGEVAIDIADPAMTLRSGSRTATVQFMSPEHYPSAWQIEPTAQLDGVPLHALAAPVAWACDPLADGPAGWTKAMRIEATASKKKAPGSICCRSISNIRGSLIEMVWDGKGGVVELPHGVWDALSRERDKAALYALVSGSMVGARAGDLSITSMAVDPWNLDLMKVVDSITRPVERPILVGRADLIAKCSALASFADTDFVTIEARSGEARLMAKHRDGSRYCDDSIKVHGATEDDSFDLSVTVIKQGLSHWTAQADDVIAISRCIDPERGEIIDFRPWPVVDRTNAWHMAFKR